MRSTAQKGFFLILAVCFLTHPASAAESTLPQEKLARYNDSFDTLREDVWGKIGYLSRSDQRAANFNLADVRVDGGRLRVETRTGGFSSGGLGPKIRFKGDFDIQVDCQVEFLPGIQDMDQDIQVYGSNRIADLKEEEVETIYMGIHKPEKNPAFIYCGYLEAGKPHTTVAQRVPDRFQGSLRIARTGDSVTMLYRTGGQGEWKKAGAFTRPRYETVMGFKASNFGGRRTTIGAKAPFVAFFDDFRLNAAQEILEPAPVQDMALLRIEKGLSPEKLARFTDTFDTLRDDLWEKTGFIYKAALRTDFKQGDLLAEGGRLSLVTKTGAFSRAGVGSKFTLCGDFDVQVDAQVDFMDDVQDMDQVVSCYALDKSKELEDDKLEFVMIGPGKDPEKPAMLQAGYHEKGKWTGTNRIEINRFRGTFRVIRIGKVFTALYRNEGESEWRRLSTLSRTANDIVIVLVAQNYTSGRVSINATRAFRASFDNFKVNAAQKIEESEI